MADPITAALTATAFFSFAKDLLDVVKDLNALRSRVIKAPQILDNFINEVHLLEQYLQRLADSQLLASSDAFTSSVITNLQRKLECLRKPMDKLRQKREQGGILYRITTAANYAELKDYLTDVEAAKSLAMSALQLLMHSAMENRFDTMALQLADINQLSSQIAVVTHQTFLSVDQLVKPYDGVTVEDENAIEESMHVVTGHRRRRRRHPHLRTFCFKPWFLSQVWSLSIGTTPSLWQHSLRVRRLLPPDSPILEAILSGDMQEVQRIFQSGQAHPQDCFVATRSDVRADIDAYCTPTPPLLYLAYKSCRLEILKLILQLSDVDQESSFLRDLSKFKPHLTGYKYGYAIWQECYRMLVEASDIDLTSAWAIHPFDTEPCIFHPPRESPLLTWLLQRQLDLVNGANLRNPKEMLDIAMPGSFGGSIWPESLVTYGIITDPKSFLELPQEVKDFMLVYCLTNYGMGTGDGFVKDILQAGANPLAVVRGTTAITALIEYALNYSRSYSLQKGCAGLFNVWVELLSSAGTDVDTYVRNCCHQVTTSPGGPYFQGSRIGLFDFRCNPEDMSIQIRVLHRAFFHLRLPSEVPGSYPVEAHAPSIELEQLMANPERYDSCSWSLDLEDHEVLVAMDEQDLREHTAYSEDSELNATQDDHGIVARSFMQSTYAETSPSRSRVHPRITKHGRPRSMSQPRSLYGFARLCLQQTVHRWQDCVHRCPLDPSRHIHWLGSQLATGTTRWEYLDEEVIDDPGRPWDSDLRACTRDHPVFQRGLVRAERQLMSIFDHWQYRLRNARCQCPRMCFAREHI